MPIWIFCVFWNEDNTICLEVFQSKQSAKIFAAAKSESAWIIEKALITADLRG